MFSRIRMLSNVESKSMKYPSWILKAREEKKGHEMKGPEARSGRAEASVSLRSLPHSASVFSQLLHCARGGGLQQHMYVQSANSAQKCLRTHLEFQHVRSFCKLSPSNLFHAPKSPKCSWLLGMTRPLCIFLCDICALVCTQGPLLHSLFVSDFKFPNDSSPLVHQNFVSGEAAEAVNRGRCCSLSLHRIISNKDRRNVLAVQKSRNNSYNIFASRDAENEKLETAKAAPTTHGQKGPFERAREGASIFFHTALEL